MFLPRLLCDACGARIFLAIDAYVYVLDYWTEASFVHKACLPLVMGGEEGVEMRVEEASIFLHRFLHNLGEEVAAENLSLIRECRIIGKDYEGL